MWRSNPLNLGEFKERDHGRFFTYRLTILNKGLDATQMAQAEREAREWLHSIGSEL